MARLSHKQKLRMARRMLPHGYGYPFDSGPWRLRAAGIQKRLGLVRSAVAARVTAQVPTAGSSAMKFSTRNEVKKPGFIKRFFAKRNFA